MRLALIGAAMLAAILSTTAPVPVKAAVMTSCAIVLAVAVFWRLR